MKNLIQKYKEIFPEEAFYAGLDAAGEIGIDDQKFAKRFARHLDFYQKHLLSLPSEQRYKRSNLLFYKSVAGVANKKELKELESLLLEIDEDTKKGEVVRLDVSYGEMLGNLYGVKAISMVRLKKDLSMYLGQKKTSPKIQIEKMELPAIKSFIKLVFDELGMRVPDVDIQMVPKELLPIMPTASAYTFFRLDVSRRVFKVFFADRKITLSKLLFVIVHEVLGHINHFDLVIKNCEDKIKLLPSISRYGLTEGVALLAEDLFLDLCSKEGFVKDIAMIFGVESEQLGEDIKASYADARILRILRAIFEIEIYKNKISPKDAVMRLAATADVDEENLKADLYSFLYTPGYASCYFAGYLAMKGKLDLKNPLERIKLGKFGLGFMEEYLVFQSR